MSSTRNSVDSQTKSSQIPGTFPSPPDSPGLSLQRNLAREVFERRNEYVKQQKIKIKIGSWNVAACPGTENDVEGWFAKGKGVVRSLGGLRGKARSNHDDEVRVETFVEQERRVSPDEPTIPKNDMPSLPGNDEIGIYALGLQEIVDINSATEALRPYNDPHPARRWKEAVSSALPEGYVLLAEQRLIGLLILIYASPNIASITSSVSTAYVGTGLMGYMGNKGAVSVRIILGETTKMVFVNSHLAAGNDKASLERRNWDAAQILQRTRFDPIDHGHGVVDEVGDMIGDEDFAFWFGDLNYRLGGIPGDDVRRLLMLHTRKEYHQKAESRVSIDEELHIKDPAEFEISDSNAETGPGSGSDSSIKNGDEELDPSEDPASVQTTISSLMTHDQLREQMRLHKAFHQGWREGPIKFLPTYKYDVGSVGMFDSSEKKRSPSWCDRILFRTRKDYMDHLRRKKDQEDAKKRDEEMKARGLENGGDEVIFDYDPETDGVDENFNEYKEDGVVSTSGDTPQENRIGVNFYTSHQRVLSSDHKPLDAIFAVEYDAVDPALKAMVHQEVARELDKAENEGRPSITVIFENHDLSESPNEGCNFRELRFDDEKSVLMTIANTSLAPAKFEFVDRHGVGPTPAWLKMFALRNHAEISRGQSAKMLILEPGDTTTIEVIALVTEMRDLCSFNEGTAEPQDVLILRVHNGRDHFIPVHGIWQRSCFGLSLDKLVRLRKEGARNQPLGAELDRAEVRGSAPQELFRLTEALEENLSGVSQEKEGDTVSRFGRAGWPFLGHPTESASKDPRLLSIREALDTGSPIILSKDLSPSERTELLAQTLVLFLFRMPGRIVSSPLWTTLSLSLSEHEKAKQPPLKGEDLRSHVLDVFSISPTRSVSFTFIMFMLARIIAQLAPLDDTSIVPPTPMTPKTPDALLSRARGLSLRSDPRAARRKEVEKAFVDIFTPLIFESETPEHRISAKATKVETDRKKTVLKAFMRSREEDGL